MQVTDFVKMPHRLPMCHTSVSTHTTLQRQAARPSTGRASGTQPQPFSSVPPRRFRRVWTPFGQQILLVDSDDGRSLPVEALSQGGREQLFLCLRLALAHSYAQRGAALPMVLDDVLVNFDEERAKAAAALLRDFAEGGHQVLVFTCHEHLARLFKSLRVDVRRLPSHSQSEAPAEPDERPKRPRRRRPEPEEPPHRLVAEMDEEEPPAEEDDASEAPEPPRLEHQAPWEEADAIDVDPPLDEPPEAHQADDAEAA